MSETSEIHPGDDESSGSSSQKFFGTEFIDRVAHRLDLSATFLLGFAAVLIAWGSYQSTLWGGVQDRLLTESVNTTTQATDRLQQADTIRSLDQVLFVELFSSGVCEEEGDGAICDQIFANMSADGVEAVEAHQRRSRAVWGRLRRRPICRGRSSLRRRRCPLCSCRRSKFKW